MSKQLFAIIFGGAGFTGWVGTSGYFFYRDVKINNMQRDINESFWDLENSVVIWVNTQQIKNIKGSENNEESYIKRKIEEIKQKNADKWKYYTKEVESILKKYQEIIDKAKTNFSDARNSLSNLPPPPKISN